jgi:hypothetical protein
VRAVLGLIVIIKSQEEIMKKAMVVLSLVVVAGFGVVYYGCQDAPQNVVVEEPAQNFGSDNGDGGAEDEPLYTRPLPVLDIPEEIRFAGDWERVRDWVDGLTTDDLQRYNITPSRGADPRVDVPRDYRNRAEVIEMLLRIGLYNAGVEAAGDQAAWLARNMNCDEGLLFARVNADGPDWGWKYEMRGSLDDPCSGGVLFVEKYYIWRVGAAPTGSVHPWSATGPIASETFRTILAGDAIKISGPKDNYLFCQANVRYLSQTYNDGRLVKWNGANNVTDGVRFGYFNGLSVAGGRNIRETSAQGFPWWSRSSIPDCIAGCGSRQFVEEPSWAEINPAPRFLVREFGSDRYSDFTVTQCSYFNEAETARLWYDGYLGLSCWPDPGHDCEEPWPLNVSDFAFFGDGDPNHNAQAWVGSTYNDPEAYYYNSVTDPLYSEALITRNVEYRLDAFVHHEPGTYSVGGYMNQVMYRSDTQGGTYAYFIDDGKTQPQEASPAGNSQDITTMTVGQDSTDWQNKYIKAGCRPFWRWNTWYSDSTYSGVYPYFLQLAKDGIYGCVQYPGAYNSFDLDGANNPRICVPYLGPYFAGSISYDDQAQNHEPWKAHGEIQGQLSNGWLHPSLLFVRQQGPTHDHECYRYSSTYYPLKSKLADGTTAGSNYPGSYVTITWKSGEDGGGS